MRKDEDGLDERLKKKEGEMSLEKYNRKIPSAFQCLHTNHSSKKCMIKKI